jgi:hypothetical protein
MNHPSELLADLVDGTLDADARAGVEAHLATCPTCRGDLAAATAGRDAARGLVPAPAPTDLRDRIVAAAGGRGGAGTARGPSQWYRWAGAAAAAAVIVALATTLPDIGGGSTGEAASDEAPGGRETYGVGAAEMAVALEVRDGVDYGPEDLERLAEAADMMSAGNVSAGAQFDAAGTEEADRAASCVVRSFETRPPGQLVRLIRARFQGRDAYVAVYLEGPGAGQAPDLGVVYVTSADDCSFVTVTQARL